MIKELIFSIFVDPRKDLKKIKPIVEKFRNEVYSIGEIEDPLIGILRMYNAVSKFEDMDYIQPILSKFRVINYGQHERDIEVLEKLNVSIRVFGRDKDGRNRTVHGQVVTMDDIYFPSPMSGIRPLKLSSWIGTGRVNSPLENQFRSMMVVNGRDIINSLDHLLKIA